MTHIVLIDNRDSFVYNLAEALADHSLTVVRNTAPVNEVLALRPDLIVGSPGPGHPADAGNLLELVQTPVPYLGICLGFQALLHVHGATVKPCGPVHGQTDVMTAQPHPIFPRPQEHVARYHSLGATEAPGLRTLATIGDLIMAAETPDGRAVGFQFHPESILTPDGPALLDRTINYLLTQGTRPCIQNIC